MHAILCIPGGIEAMGIAQYYATIGQGSRLTRSPRAGKIRKTTFLSGNDRDLARRPAPPPSDGTPILQLESQGDLGDVLGGPVEMRLGRIVQALCFSCDTSQQDLAQSASSLTEVLAHGFGGRLELHEHRGRLLGHDMGRAAHDMTRFAKTAQNGERRDFRGTDIAIWTIGALRALDDIVADGV